MASFNPLYTGRQSAVQFPELDSLEKSQQRSQELLIKGEEQKLDKYLKDKDAFKKMLAIDPIAAVSQANALKQGEKLREYNAKWAARYARANGNLTDIDNTEMAMDKSILQAEQNKMLADQEQFKNLQSVLQKDTEGYYDRKILQAGIDKYYKTGVLDPNILVVAPQDINSLLAKDAPQTKTMGVKTIGGQTYSEEGNRTKEEAQEQIFQKLKHEPVLRFVIEDFNSQPDKVQYDVLKDYDKDGNARIDPNEMEFVKQNMNVRDNPIVKWAMNNERYLATSMGINPNVPKNPPSSNKGGFSINFGGKDIKTAPAYKRNGPQPYGDQIFYNVYAFPSKITVDNIPTSGGVIYTTDYSEDAGAGNVQGYIKDYVADKDLVIIEPIKGYGGVDIPPSATISVPAGNIPDIDKLPIKGENGQMTTIGALRGSKPSRQKGLLD